MIVERYGEGVKPQEVQGEASGVQQEKAQDTETVKPKQNQNPRGLQGQGQGQGQKK